MKRIRVLVLVLSAVFLWGSLPSVSAVDEPHATFSGGEWLTPAPCTADGAAMVDLDMYIPAGFTWHSRYWTESPTQGPQYYEYSWSQAFDYVGLYTGYIMPVPQDGRGLWNVEILDLNGAQVSSTSVEVNCVTGAIFPTYGDVYGVHEPAADKRVMGNVLVDTPVYSEPSPTAALKPVLKAGQTWFIVGQVTGTDGELWYKVFVGSANTAYVPASTMAPQGAVPGAK
ncbi:MAG TPA: hypothetical protein VHP83_14080 [Aggregatilineaceae bacterium]|nr:hypothetical protein [Aggregatilineaceae bacterium]